MQFRNALSVIDGCSANEQRRLSHEYGLGKLLFLSFPIGKMYAVGIISFMSLLVKHMHLKFGFYRTHNSVCTLYRLVWKEESGCLSTCSIFVKRCDC